MNNQLLTSESAMPVSSVSQVDKNQQLNLLEPELYEEITNILEKLAPQNFQMIVNQVNSLQIDTEEKLTGLVGLVYEKAVNEPNFSITYAKLCNSLAMMKIPCSKKENNSVTFHKLLLNKCHKEYGTDSNDEGDKDREPNKESKEIKCKARGTTLGKLKFHEELFKLHLLNVNNMHNCVKKLLSGKDTDSLECLCRLLTSIGKELESAKNKGNNENKMDFYFKQMQEIVHKKQTSSRACSMLQTVIDLRSNNWIQKRNENNPNISPVHQIAEHEAFQSDALLQQKANDCDERKTIQDIKLSQSSNAWKPSSKQRKEVIDLNAIQTEELYKKVSSILKFTEIPNSQKFQTQVNQFNALPINTEERLKGVIDLVFEKAINEPNFSVAYANLCKCLAMMKVPLSNKENDYVNFRKLLLNKCQKEFEKDLNDEVDRENKIKDISQSESEEKKKQLIEQYEEIEHKAKRRYLGNITFIGELFKLHMLTANIMHDCLKKLLSQEDEDSLECLCRLLTTIGKDMESDKNKGNTENKMNVYFTQMQEIVHKKQTSSRVRFILQDVIDLRSGNWIPRRDENNPKTIDQIHQEAEREAFEREALLQQMSSHRRSDDRDKRKLSSSPMESKWLGSHYMERRTKLIIDEFLRNNDLKEAALNVRSLCSHSTVHLFVTSALNLVMKHSSQARLYVGQLTDFLVKEKIILVEQYIKGLKGISSMAEEYAIDIPNFWRNLAELIVPIIQSGTIPLSYLREIAQPCVEVGLAGKLISEVLHALAENMRLDFTIARRESLLQPQMSLEEIKEHLTNILQKKADNEVIFDWINSHVTEAQTKEFAFVRALMTAVVQGVLEGTGTTWNLQEEAFRKQCTLLLKYLDHKDEFELQALYALQVLMHQMEQPKSILCQIFDTLYDEDVISKEAFLQWESSDNPAEQEGKGVALSSARTFYTWLREMDNESPEES